MAYKRLGDVLIDAGLITEDQLGHALKQQKETKTPPGRRAHRRRRHHGSGPHRGVQMQLGVEFVDLSAIDLDPELSRVISKNVARQYNVVPVRTSPDEVCLAMSDPLNFMAIEAVKNATRKRVIPMVTTHDSLMRAIMTLYGNEGAAPRHRGDEARRPHDRRRRRLDRIVPNLHAGRRRRRAIGSHGASREQHHRASRHRARQRYPPGAARDRPACAHAYRRRACARSSRCRRSCRLRSSRV